MGKYISILDSPRRQNGPSQGKEGEDRGGDGVPRTPGPRGRRGVRRGAHLRLLNDTFVHVTDLSGRETLCKVTGGMKVKADRDESSPYAAMLAAQDVAEKIKTLGITALHIKLKATGGNRTKTPGP